MDDYKCPHCGFATDQTDAAQAHYSSSITVYRFITDEPQGICIGFRPQLEETDLFCLNEDNGGEFVHIDHGMITINNDPEGAEPPDLYIWRSRDEWEEWASEMGLLD